MLFKEFIQKKDVELLKNKLKKLGFNNEEIKHKLNLIFNQDYWKGDPSLAGQDIDSLEKHKHLASLTDREDF